MEVIKREREELHILQEDKFEIEEVIQIFADDSYEVIYVESDDGLFQGVISYGDCLKHLDEERELINRNPITLTVDTQEQMVDIFASKGTIRNIAILDENSRILYEFAKPWAVRKHYDSNKKQEKIYCALLERCGIKNIAFIECETWGKRFQKYSSLAEMGINIILTDSYTGINADDSIIVDGNYIRSLVKKKEGYCVAHSDNPYDFIFNFFEFSWSNRLLKHVDWFTDRVVLSYEKIAVIDSNEISKQIIEELKKNGKKITIFSKDDFIYDIFTKQYVLQEECDAEVIITCTFDYICQKIVCDGGEIYNLNFILMGFRDTNKFFWDRDIVNNILPRLVKKDVKVAIFYMQFEYKHRLAVKSILEYNLVKEYKKVFGIEDGVWNISGDYKNGYFELISSNSPYYTLLEDGTRKTVGNDGESDYSIFFFGRCESFGWGVKDEETAASYLQTMVSSQYNVYNYSNNSSSQIPWKMRVPDYQSGDIVLLFCQDREIYEQAGYSVFEISTDHFSDMKLEEVAWWNFMHGNKKVTKRFAEIIYDYLVNNDYFIEEENAD